MSSVPQSEHGANADDGIPVLTEVVSASVLANTQRLAVLDASAANPQLEKTQNFQIISAPPATAAAPTAPAAGFAAALPPLNHPAASVPPAHATAAGIAPSPSTTDSDAELEALSLRVQSRVLDGLMKRIDPVVDQRLRESLTDLLEQVLAGMTAELKVTARRIVRDAVAQAVAAELATLHKSTLPPP